MNRHIFTLILVLILGWQSRVLGNEENRDAKLSEDALLYYEATLFDKAIPLFEELLEKHAVPPKEKAKILLYLGKSYYFSGKYSQIPALFANLEIFFTNRNKAAQEYDTESLFLLGLTFAKLNEYEKSVSTWHLYLNQESLTHRFEAIYELGHAYYQMGKYENAKNQFEKIPLKPNKKIFLLSKIHLARLAILQKKYNEAETILEELQEIHPKKGLSPFAIAFIQGEISFSKGDFKKAIQYFEKAQPEKNPQSVEWAEESLFYLGLSHLNDAKNPLAINEAENIFKKLTTLYPSDRITLALAQCYLSKSIFSKDLKASEQLEQLLGQAKFLNEENAYKALLFRTENSPDYDRKKKFLIQITNENHQNNPFYPQGLYLAGKIEYEEGKANRNCGNKLQAMSHLEKALIFLQKAFDVSYLTDKKLASQSLKLQLEVYQQQDSTEAHLKALKLLEKLLNDYRAELFQEWSYPEEIFFLQGFFAANLSMDKEECNFFHVAENSLKHLIESYPKSLYYDEAKRLLGHLYYLKEKFEQAEVIFLQLAHQNPPSPFTAEALFWASNSAEMGNKKTKFIRHYRKKLYEDYPNSSFAPEAYFRLYDYAEYLKGKPKALQHLADFKNLYPHSPYVLNVLYIKALNYLKEKKNESVGIATLSELESTFHTLYEKDQIPKEELEYFVMLRYRALFEKALASLATVDKSPQTLNEAEKNLYQIYYELDNTSNYPAKWLNAKESIIELQDLSALQLIKCYRKQRKDASALQLLETLLEKHKNNQVTRGPHLSNLWIEYGKIAAGQETHDLAIKYFKEAEEAAKGKVLHTDELLDLWIEQSQSYRKLGKTDEAMLLLSRVINYDAVSENRLKAMFLRALLYEEQGRGHLAKKQLEAIAKKKGQWALKAKEKLEESYVYK